MEKADCQLEISHKLVDPIKTVVSLERTVLLNIRAQKIDMVNIIAFPHLMTKKPKIVTYEQNNK